MKNFILKRKGLVLGGALMVGGALSAQVQVNQLTEFGSALYDINNEGKAVHGNGYYDFTTNASSVSEDNVAQTVTITNSDIILGLIIDSNDNFVPASRVDGVWAAFPESAFNPSEEYTVYDISDNGMYVVGQTGWTPENGAWGFIYNTQTEVYTLLSSDLYEYGAAYGVNNNGIAVGWVDDLPFGTVRMPAYFTEDGTITLIQEDYGEASGINDNNVIVGTFGGNGFIYDITSNEYMEVDLPTGYHQLSFTDISDTNVVVGYGEYIDPVTGFARDPFIYKSDFSSEPILISELLDDLEVDYDETIFDGQGYKISSNGKYIAGWTSGPAFVASGWAIYLDDLFEDLGVNDLIANDFAYYPNPVKDVLNFNSKKTVQSVEAFNLTGQKVISSTKVNNGQIDTSSLSVGTYVFKVTLESGQIKTFKIIKK